MSNLSAITSVNPTDYTGYTEQIEAVTTPAGAATAEIVAPAVNFTAVFADAMRDGLMRSTATASSAMPGMQNSYLPIENQGIEQAILAAASSGQIDDAQIALFMLMAMMQSNQDGEFGMMMALMGTMLMQMQGDKNTLRDNAMAADFHPFVLDEVDRHLFNWRTPQTTGTGQVILPVEAWRPTTPAVTSSVGNRSPELYRAVIDQFKVETAERYRPFRNGSTYCNIFTWDVTRAMGAELPHYTDPETGVPRFYPDIRGARSMGAIATCEWLRTHGPKYGWREVDAETAQRHANSGRPAVTSAGSLGHVQVICPSKDGGFDPIRGVTVAQAGRIVTNYMHISSTYSANALANNVRYWIHD